LLNGSSSTRAQILVAVLGASNLTYACATRTQQAEDWVRSIIAALEFIGGVPRLLVSTEVSSALGSSGREVRAAAAAHWKWLTAATGSSRCKYNNQSLRGPWEGPVQRMSPLEARAPTFAARRHAYDMADRYAGVFPQHRASRRRSTG
jgi:hypothetical protein